LNKAIVVVFELQNSRLFNLWQTLTVNNFTITTARTMKFTGLTELILRMCEMTKNMENVIEV